MSIHSFDDYESSINNHYKSKSEKIMNNRKNWDGKMSTYVNFLTGNSGTNSTFKAPESKFINMSKAPNYEEQPLVTCTNDKGGRDSTGKKIITKPFSWFVNNNNQFDFNKNNRNNNLLDNIIKNDSDLYVDSYLSNILNGTTRCVYRAGPESDIDAIRNEINDLNQQYKKKLITKEELETKKQELNSNTPWIKRTEDEQLKKLGKFKFKDGFSNYNETKKNLGLLYFTSLSAIIFFIMCRLK